MTNNQFAIDIGYESFEEIVEYSCTVYHQKITWYVTPTQFGYLAWNNNCLEKPLGYFDTFDLAKQEIMELN